MFDRRKATIEAAVVVDTWLTKIGQSFTYLPQSELDALHVCIEQHLEVVWRRGYFAALDDKHPDNQKSE